MFHRFFIALSLLALAFTTLHCGSTKCQTDRDCAKDEYCTDKNYCRSRPTVKAAEGKRVATNDEPSEAEKEAAYKARLKAKENQPEPELDPSSPREKLEWVLKAGDNELSAIHEERAAIIAKIGDYKIKVPEHQKVIKAGLKILTDFSIGLKPAEIEDAPKRLCTAIEAIRKPIEAMNDSVRKQLRAVNGEWEAYNKVEEAWAAKEQEKGKLSRKEQKSRVKNNKKMLKIQDIRDKVMPSINAGNATLLGMRSLLKESMILAKFGARRTQKALGQCLSELNKNYISLDLVQNVMNKVIRRCKYYRE